MSNSCVIIHIIAAAPKREAVLAILKGGGHVLIIWKQQTNQVNVEETKRR